MADPFESTQAHMQAIKEQLVAKMSVDDDNVIGMKMRNIFLKHPDGPEVLEFLLKELKYNTTIGSLPEIALHNVAVRVIEIMGLLKEGEVADQIRNWNK